MYRLRSPTILRRLTDLEGLTAEALAAQVLKDDGTRVSRQLIEHLLSGRRRRATAAVAQSIADALKVPLDDLWLPAGPRTRRTTRPHDGQSDTDPRSEESPE